MTSLTHFLDGSLEVIAPAKVNLYLHITGKRADGYHLLESLFAFTHFGDRIRVSPSPYLHMGIDGPFAASLKVGGSRPEDNLVWRAARMMQGCTGTNWGAHLHLRKNLPVAAGIGGGSADAAATLVALNSFWGLGLPHRELAEIGLELGADVPACLSPTPIHVTGVGDVIEATELATSYGILLVNNGTHVSTPAVFRNYRHSDQTFDMPLRARAPRFHGDFMTFLKTKTGNSLHAPAVQEDSRIEEILTALDTGSALISRMSGSGGTCFALYGSLKDAASAAQQLKQEHPDWWVRADRLRCR